MRVCACAYTCVRVHVRVYKCVLGGRVYMCGGQRSSLVSSSITFHAVCLFVCFVFEKGSLTTWSSQIWLDFLACLQLLSPGVTDTYSCFSVPVCLFFYVLPGDGTQVFMLA